MSVAARIVKRPILKFRHGAAALVLAALVATPIIAKRVTPPTEESPIEEARRFFTTDPDAPRVAPKGHDVTIVMYTDYQCPYCRQQTDDLLKLIRNDDKVEVLFRDWPTVHESSRDAARAAIAANYQGKYLAVHEALMRAPRPLDAKRIEAAVRGAGADWKRLQADLAANETDIDDLIQRNHDQALMLGMTGTPGFIIGNTQRFGTMPYAALVKAVADERAKAGGAATPATIRKSRRP